MLEFLAVDRNFPEFVEAGDMGRSVGKVEGFQESECVDAFARAAGFLHAEHSGYSFAKPGKPVSSEDTVFLPAGHIVVKLGKDPAVTAKPLIAPPPAFDPRPGVFTLGIPQACLRCLRISIETVWTAGLPTCLTGVSTSGAKPWLLQQP